LGALIITVAISAIAFCMVGVKRISVSKYQATAECAQVLRFGIALSCFQRADDYRLLTAVLLILSERPSKLLRWISLAITHLACGGASLVRKIIYDCSDPNPQQILHYIVVLLFDKDRQRIKRWNIYVAVINLVQK
jgi:hypothetical protein